ncbi:MAG: hypothetical protein RL662_629, partial [Bacteroidota bacterium]
KDLKNELEGVNLNYNFIYFFLYYSLYKYSKHFIITSY